MVASCTDVDLRRSSGVGVPAAPARRSKMATRCAAAAPKHLYELVRQCYRANGSAAIRASAAQPGMLSCLYGRHLDRTSIVNPDEVAHLDRCRRSGDVPPSPRRGNGYARAARLPARVAAGEPG